MILVGTIIVGAILSGLVLAVESREYARLLKDYRARIDSVIDFRQSYIQSQIALVRNDALFLAAVPPVPGMVRAAENSGFDNPEKTPGVLWKRRLEQIFSAYLASNLRLAQIRFIGVADHGRELVHVDRVGDKIVVLPDEMLQTKGNRDFFLAT
jgi:hypothetical protein